MLIRRMRGTPTTALSALVAFATLTIVLAAQAIFACTKPVAMAMPGMDAMSMDMHQSNAILMLCPVVLLLAVAAAALTALTLFRCLHDPHRVLTGRRITRILARLSVAPATALLTFFGAGGVGTMFALDGNAPVTALGWLSLAGVILGTSLVLTLAALILARVIDALSEGIAFVVAALRIALARPPYPRVSRLRFAQATRHDVPLLATGRGLRAPPLSLR
jgi:hypothetical protein